MTIFDEEAIEKILDPNIGGGTMDKVRHIILSCFNFNTYEKIDLFGAMRNADSENRKLIVSIVNSFGSNDEEKSFFIINKIAPILIEKGMDRPFLNNSSH
jgi:hypothetical protein